MPAEYEHASFGRYRKMNDQSLAADALAARS
jgi:hypothetical protein